jgi:hypothetical protein
MEIPLVGCASHRLNLAVQDFLSLYPDTNILLTKVNVLMKDLKRLKNAAIIRCIINTRGLMPVCRNATRWSSIWEMLIRYLLLEPELHTCGLPNETKALIPSHIETQVLRELKDQLKDFQEATLYLQKDSNEVDLYLVRTLFDNLIRKYPSCAKHLATDSNIVHSKHFEGGVVKLQSNREDDLTLSESVALSAFLIPNVEEELIEEIDVDQPGRVLTLIEKTRL